MAEKLVKAKELAELWNILPLEELISFAQISFCRVHIKTESSE
jgi:hypothetical protein